MNFKKIIMEISFQKNLFDYILTLNIQIYKSLNLTEKIIKLKFYMILL